MKAAALACALGLSVAACLGGPVQMDFAGNVYPRQCLGDLSWVKTPIIEAPPSTLAGVHDAMHVQADHRVYGVTMDGLIFIDSTLRGGMRDDVIRHERCHVIAGRWHS